MTIHRFAVVGDLPKLAAVVEWYAAVSDGSARLVAEPLAAVEPTEGWHHFASRGGLGPPPANSQGLAAAVLGGMDRRAVAAAGGVIVLVTPARAGFAPHAWRLRAGGFWLGGRDWCRRYAVIPDDAAVGTVAHELGHLLFGWPDHHRRRGIGADCLMGTGAADDQPAPPCAPLRVGMGWARPQSVHRLTSVGELTAGLVMESSGKLIERGPSGDLVVYDGLDVVGRVSAGAERPLLAAVAASLRAPSTSTNIPVPPSQ